MSVILGLTAAGNSQSTALQLDPTYRYYGITTCPVGAGVTLAPSSNGAEKFVQNDSSNSLLVYPTFAGQFDALSLNTPISVPPKSGIKLASTDGYQCFSFNDGKGLTQFTPNQVIGTTANPLPASIGVYTASGGTPNAFVLSDSSGKLNCQNLIGNATLPTLTCTSGGLSSMTSSNFSTPTGSIGTLTSTLANFTTLNAPTLTSTNPNITSATCSSLTITGGLSVAGTATFAGNLTCGKIQCDGVTSSGPITGTTLTYSGPVSSQSFTSTGAITAPSISISAGINTATGNLGAISASSATFSGTVGCAGCSSSGTISGTTLTLSGTCSADSILANGVLTAATGTFAGTMSGSDIIVTGTITANHLDVGTLKTNDLHAPAGTMTVNALRLSDTGATPLSSYSVGTYTLSISGCWTSSQNLTVTLTKFGSQIWLKSGPVLAAASISGGQSLLSPVFIPAPMRPVNGSSFPVLILDNAVQQFGKIFFQNGLFIIYAGVDGSGFSGFGNSGLMSMDCGWNV